jgi:hypothetical protein
MPTSLSEPMAATARAPRGFTRAVAAAGLPPEPEVSAPVTEADLAGLPASAQRYLRAMGVVGGPRTWSLRAHFLGRFRRGPDQQWMPVDAWQYNSAIEVARLFRMRLIVGRVMPVWGWDTYRAGHGRMLGKALGLVSVADGSGPEFDTSELVTWLNDAVLLAPAMLLRGGVGWSGDTGGSFEVSVTDAGRTVRAEVLLDDDGRPRDFRTEDRCADLPGGLVQAPWSTPVEGWALHDGRPSPIRAAAVWHLPDQEYRYGELALADLALDVPPGR